MTIKHTENLIPKMTSDTTPIGIASASSIYNNNYLPYKAFDADDKTCWITDIRHYKNEWICYEFDKLTLINGYSILASSAWGEWSIDCNPYRFKFEAYDEKLSDWITLDSREIDKKEWISKNGYLEFYFINKNAYKKYRIFIIDTYQNKNYIQIISIKMMKENNWKVLIEQNENYYSINNHYIGIMKENNNLENLIKEYGYNDLSILTKELNNKKIPTKKVNNDHYESFDIELNDVKDNIYLIKEDNKKYIQYDCDTYRILDKIKENNNGKFDILMKEF